MNTQFAYDKMDYYSILSYLKEQATYFSDGVWTDFSDGDLGTIILKLMAMNADTTNYQIEKGISELYIDTVVERSNAIALCKLIGYEPKHYQSAKVDLTLSNETGNSSVLNKYNLFTNKTGDVKYYNIEEYTLNPGLTTVECYEGLYSKLTFSMNDITDEGTIILDDYNIGTNTINISQGGIYFKHVDNAIYGDSSACFSIHMNSDNNLYIQLPTYYKNFVTNAPIIVEYLLSNGYSGRIGSNILTGQYTNSNGNYNYYNTSASEGGYNPETVEDIRQEAPAFASTMNTLVTLNDFRVLVKDFDGISDVVALDYNYKETGLVQPTDAYKVNVYILPTDVDTIINTNTNTYYDFIKTFITDVDLKRLNSLTLSYKDVTYVKPHITIKVYMDQYDLRYGSASTAIKDYIVSYYSRANGRKIGQALYKSHISSVITSYFDYVKYIEVLLLEGESDGAIKPNNLTFIDIIADNINVQVVPYTE